MQGMLINSMLISLHLAQDSIFLRPAENPYIQQMNPAQRCKDGNLLLTVPTAGARQVSEKLLFWKKYSIINWSNGYVVSCITLKEHSNVISMYIVHIAMNYLILFPDSQKSERNQWVVPGATEIWFQSEIANYNQWNPYRKVWYKFTSKSH